jgi:hypothetical protein
VRTDPLTKILTWAVAASLVACVVVALFLIGCCANDFADWF